MEDKDSYTPEDFGKYAGALIDLIEIANRAERDLSLPGCDSDWRERIYSELSRAVNLFRERVPANLRAQGQIRTRIVDITRLIPRSVDSLEVIRT